MEELCNVMEESVFKKIDKIWPTTKYCKCEQCRLDIAVYALNRLPPRYVHSLEAKLLHQFNASTIQNDAEITACVANAIRVVGEDPNHEIEE